jgi:S-adenosylmethionine hydrolase
MPVITITSDWKNSDYYLPVLKGRIMSLFQEVSVVDITNAAKSFDVSQACFILKNSYRSFPKGSIHLITVGSGNILSKELVVVKANGHYFIGENDGRFSLLLDDVVSSGGEIDAGVVECKLRMGPMAEADYYCRGIAAVLNGDQLQSVSLVKSGSDKAVVMIDKIIGRVVYIDSYGNAITNISQHDFMKVFGLMMDAGCESEEDMPDFVIYAGGPHLRFDEISDGYDSVSPGNEVAFFNSLGVLELAVNRGDFASLEGVDTTTEVMVKFG